MKRHFLFKAWLPQEVLLTLEMLFFFDEYASDSASDVEFNGKEDGVDENLPPEFSNISAYSVLPCSTITLIFLIKVISLLFTNRCLISFISARSASI